MNDLKERLVSSHLVFNEKKSIAKWMDDLRHEAIDIFDKRGFPHRKLEKWRFTNLAPLLKKIINSSQNQKKLQLNTQT